MNEVPMIPTLINGRWTLLLPEHRAVRPEWGTVEGWERARLDSMHEHLTRLAAGFRPLIIDVGVEEGDLTALYALWGCDVAMVEPNPLVWPNAKVIFEANNLRPPEQFWVGFAAEQTGGADLEWFNTHVGSNTVWPMCASGPVIGDHAFLHLAQAADYVPSIALDELMGVSSPHGHRKVDAITMDVEGSELRVLRGAEQILIVDRPLVWVSVHTDDQWMQENYRQDRRVDIDAFMAWWGYVPEHLATDHEEHVFYYPEEYGRWA